jgi:hypothetical protein
MAEDRDDEDRRAILARRNRFIAVALSGLTSAVAPGCADDADSPSPAPCLDQIQMTPLDPPKPEPPPEPCLEVVTPEPPPDPPPDPPPETPMMNRPDMRPPRVCLRYVGPRTPPPPAVQPQPCLDMPAPQVCLEYIEKPGGYDDDDEGDA